MSRRVALRLALAVVAALAPACGGSGGPMSPPPSADLDADGLADLDEEALLRQYRPVWDFDETETLFPISLEEWAALGERIEDGTESAPYADVESLLAAVQAFPDGVMVTAEEPYAGFPPCGAGALCNDAPVFVDAIPVGFSLRGRDDLVWLQYWIFYHYDLKQALPGSQVRSQHHGDWEHVCVLVSLDDLGARDAAPVSLHFHAHGGLEVHDEASAWHADDAGSFHPHVYVEASGHASYRDAGGTLLGPHEGGRIDPDGLSHPLVFLRPHATNRGDPSDEILGGFRGRWGQTEGDTGVSPLGPLAFNQPCDHDWKASPGLSDWLPACST